MAKYEIWLEGHVATGTSSKAKRINRDGETTLWEGENFKTAVINALLELKWDMSYYNDECNSFWACGFYDNEQDARRAFG
jgi:hypothetical protein